MHTRSRGILALVIAITVLGQPRGAVNLSPSSADRSGAEPADPNSADAETDAGKKQLIKAFESSLLNMFGLKTRPRPGGKVHIPQQMLDLYRSEMRDPYSPTNIDINVNPGGTSANTVRSFHHDEDSSSNIDNDSNRITCIFNSSTLATDEELTGAELRLHRSAVSESELLEFAKFHNTLNPHRHRIDVYEILQPASTNRESITRLLDTRVVDVRNSSWESFDVRPAVLKKKKVPTATLR